MSTPSQWPRSVHRTVREESEHRAQLPSRAELRDKSLGFDIQTPGDQVWDFIHPLFGVAFVALSFGSTRPLGFTGYALALTLLLTFSSAVTLSRLLPDRLLPEPYRLVLITTGLVASSALLACSSHTFAGSLVFMLAGHAGYRYPLRQAMTLGAIASVCTAGGLAIAELAHHPGWQWYFGFFAGMPVLIGTSRRNRYETLLNAKLVVEQTMRASESEARERALAERARIARDIHDVLAHSLSGVNMQLELAGALFEGGRDEQAHEALARAQGMVRDGLAEAKRAVSALREDALPLPETLTRLFDTGTDFSLVGPPRDVSVEVSQTFVRAAQEAVTNIRRHAPGAFVQATLEFEPALARLRIHNGRAQQTTNDSHDQGSGLGLVGMRERASLLGGTVSTGPDDDGGWLVVMELPA